MGGIEKMKKINKIIIALVSIGVIIASVASCSNNTKKDEEIPSSSQTETKDAKSSQEEEVKGKYSDNEVYKSDDGTEYSKTEDGAEVELSGDNFQNLMEEYEKVKGTGSEREKELLDQIQVIMDIISAKSPE